MNYKIKHVPHEECFEVPDIIADKHLRLASGDMIKVLLLLLRNSSGVMSAAQIAKKLKMSESDAEDCLQYWELTGVIAEEGAASGAEPESEKPEKYIPSPAPGSSRPEAERSPVQVSRSRPGHEEISKRMDESKEISAMFSDLQDIMGRTIGWDGQATFLMLHDSYGLPAQVIYMLAKHCVDIGKSGYSYIEAVGRGWSESEIDTVEKAAEKIASYDKVRAFWNKFVTAADIKNPAPTQKQIAYIEKWITARKMSFELIYKAYEEMAEHTGKLSFAYMDKVLESWYASGFKSPADVENAQKAKRDAKAAVSQNGASYSLDDYIRKEIDNKPVYKPKKKRDKE